MDFVLGLFMLVGIALGAGAFVLFRRGDRTKALLMVIAALVMFGNVAILIAPVSDDLPPVTEERADAPLE